jgi:nucleotide-binding universal stress UspA family protein
MEAGEKRANEEFAQAEELFRDAAGSSNSVEWRQAFRPSTFFLCEQARAADLVIVGRHAALDPPHGSLGVAPADVIMQCGRPVLVVPPMQRSISAERIVIAWKDTREARRVVADCMTFLKQAKEVFVVSIRDDEDASGPDDVVAHLRRHGVPAEALIRAGRLARDPSDDILNIVAEKGADLVVCGAYGHSRMRVFVLGGVTRALLNSSFVACLMSH